MNHFIKNLAVFTVLTLIIGGFSYGSESRTPEMIGNNHINVLDFGAKGDKTTDSTAAFQSALNEAGKDTIGGTVFVPQGTYLIKTHLNIPRNVTLEGIWNIPTAWSQYQGTTLLAVEGEGDPDAAPFIFLNTNSVLKGLTIFYPNQVYTYTPKPYPWTIAGSGDNCSIIDVLVVNPYQAVDFGSKPAGRHYIRNLYAQPILNGLYVNQCYDVGRVENIHFWPFWTCNDPKMKGLEKFISENGRSFIFGRTDWEYVFNTFSWGYNIGYHFVKTEHGYTNGNFQGIGADATNRAVVVEESAPYGLLITNGEFVSMLGDDPTSVFVGKSNSGVVQFQNCAFWGPAARIGLIDGQGTVTFNNCNFTYWDYEKHHYPALEANGGNLIVSSSNFNRPGHHIKLNAGINSAVITGNRFSGGMRITNASENDVQIGLNTQSDIRKEEPGAIVIDDSDQAPAFRTEGIWYSGAGGGDYKGLTHWAYKGDGTSKAYWTPDIPEAGTYEVFIWYGRDPFENHATDAGFIVKHKNGTSTVPVDLKENCGQWFSMGEFEFDAGNNGYVMVSNKANNNMVADAVKLLRK